MVKGYQNGGYQPDQLDRKNNTFNNPDKVLEHEKKSITTEYSDDYDPYEHRDIKHPISTPETLLHLLKGSLGTGILAMPVAFKNAGFVLGIIATFAIGLICTHCVHVISNANYKLSKRKRVSHLTYPELAECAMSGGPGFIKKLTPYTSTITKVFLVIVQLGTSCVYVVFISSNIKAIVDFYTAKENWIDVRLYMCMILLPLILINWVRNLKYLAPLTTIGNLATVISFAIILYYIFRDPLSVEGKDYVGRIEKFPLFLGTVLFALEVIGMIIPLQNEMRNPADFVKPTGVLNIGMATIIPLYIAMGCFGYLCYGSKVAGSITLNLAEDEVLAQSVKAMLAFSIFITHALQSYVAIDVLWDVVKKRLSEKSNQTFWEYVIRTVTVLLTFVFGIAIPHLELFISLVGGLCFSVLGLVLPATIQIATWWYETHGWARVQLIVVNSIVFFVGIMGFVVSTAVSLMEIIEKISSPSETH